MYLSQIHYSWNCLYKCLLFSVLQWFWPLLHQGNKKKKSNSSLAPSRFRCLKRCRNGSIECKPSSLFSIFQNRFGHLHIRFDCVLMWFCWNNSDGVSRKGPETNWISTWISHNPPARASAPIALEIYSNLNFFFLCLLVLSFALESLAACCYTAKQKKIFKKKT